MKAVECPDHGDLVLDLARGRLHDQRAEEAETVRRDCVVCARWWDETFRGEAFDAVDAAVAEAVSSFVPPNRRRTRWLAAVAALVLAVGVATTSMLWRDAQPSPAISSDVVSTWDFEDGDHRPDAIAAADTPTPGDQTIFKSDLESGDLSFWSSHSN